MCEKNRKENTAAIPHREQQIDISGLCGATMDESPPAELKSPQQDTTAEVNPHQKGWVESSLFNRAMEGASSTQAGRLCQCINVLGKKLNLNWSEDCWYMLSWEECFDLTVVDRVGQGSVLEHMTPQGGAYRSTIVLAFRDILGPFFVKLRFACKFDRIWPNKKVIVYITMYFWSNSS